MGAEGRTAHNTLNLRLGAAEFVKTPRRYIRDFRIIVLWILGRFDNLGSQNHLSCMARCEFHCVFFSGS